MTGIQFHEALWTLMLLRRRNSWPKASWKPEMGHHVRQVCARPGWLGDDEPGPGGKLWQAIWRHDPRAKELRGEATVVDLTQRRAAKAR